MITALFVALAIAVPLRAAAAAPPVSVAWHPQRPRAGDVAWLHVRAVSETATVEGSVGGRPLSFFPYAGGQAALVGFDVETRPGRQAWQVAVIEPRQEPHTLRGTVRVERRDFPRQRLTLPRGMVELDPATERRAEAEAAALRTLARTVTPVRLWRGRFTRPVAESEPGTGFGARRILNGQPRAPHTGIDYAAERGVPVVAANTGQVALVAEQYFPGRLVVVDHGLGLYTFYFHLDQASVREGERVERGQPIGKVGATGRATGPHLHFGAQAGGARIDPAALLGLAILD